MMVTEITTDKATETHMAKQRMEGVIMNAELQKPAAMGREGPSQCDSADVDALTCESGSSSTSIMALAVASCHGKCRNDKDVLITHSQRTAVLQGTLIVLPYLRPQVVRRAWCTDTVP